MFQPKCVYFWHIFGVFMTKCVYSCPNDRVPIQIVFSNSHCVFHVRPQIFPVPIYIICEYYIHRMDLAGLFSFWKKRDFFLRQLSQYPLLLESEHLQLELTKFCFHKISKFPVFPDREFFWTIFPVPWVP